MSYYLDEGHLSKKVSLWEKRVDDHKEKQLINPFSEWWIGATQKPVVDRDDPNYGRPPEGSLTELRGKKAASDISTEVVELCHIIADIGMRQADGSYVIKFGKLFNAYTRISDKVVGMLVRARRHGFVKFEGEMLYQRQDEDVLITCVHVPDYDEKPCLATHCQPVPRKKRDL